MIKPNIRLTVKNKLILSFGGVIAIMLAVSAITFIGLEKLGHIEERLLHVSLPTVTAGAELENGINLSLASLRGYMILGEDESKAAAMKAARKEGWQKIDDAMSTMIVFSNDWTDKKSIEDLNQLKVLVEDFRIVQDEIEAISHTEDDVPAFKTLLTEAAPRATNILTALSAIINEEDTLAATPGRKTLLKLLADSRGSFAVGLANIRAYLLSGDVQFQENFFAQWEVNQARFDTISTITFLMTPTQRDAWNTYASIRNEFAPLPQTMFEQRSGDDWNVASYWLATKAAPKVDEIKLLIDDLRKIQIGISETDEKKLIDNRHSLEFLLTIGTIVALVTGMGLAIFISHLITTSLRRVVVRAQDIANGDLTGKPIKLQGGDELTELTQAINEMNENLRGIIEQVSISANKMASSSIQLQGSAKKTNQGMDNQQVETEQVATAMNQMSATVQEVAQLASSAALSAASADQASALGHDLVVETVNAITLLAENIEDTSSTINKLGEDVSNVDSILLVITGISDQTNLLALNAAIEAARAGEQGRGFAVVADEVRTLAARTQESTLEIRAMLDTLKNGADGAVQAMHAGHSQAQISVEQANKTSDAITEITSAITTISDMNAQIATASEEQSSVAEEMNRSMVKISSESDTALENTLETTTAANQIEELATNMQQLVSRFKTGI